MGFVHVWSVYAYCAISEHAMSGSAGEDWMGLAICIGRSRAR